MKITDNVREFLKFDLGLLNTDEFYPYLLDESYTKDGKQTFDFYYAKKTDDIPTPLIIVVHGGGWISGHKRSKFMAPMIKPIYEGVSVAVISYTLAMKAPHPQAILDIKTSIRYFKTHATKFGIDPNKIFLWGESAGAHLVNMVGCTLDDETLCDRSMGCDEQNHQVAGVISHYGMTDFLSCDQHLVDNGVAVSWAMTDEDSLASWYLGQPILKDIKKTLTAQPMSYIHERIPPFFLRHGKKDTIVPYQQTQIFAKALTEAGIDVDVDYYAEAEHTDPMFFTNDEIKKIVQFMKRVSQ